MAGRNGILILSIIGALSGPGLHAAEPGAQFGLLYGLSVPDAQNTNHFMMFGVKGSGQLSPTYSAGGYFLASDKQGAPSAEEKFRYALVGIEGAYHVPGNTGDMYIGLRMGITKVSTNPNGRDATFSPYHYGVVTGYDYKLFYNVIVGFEGSYLHVQRGKSPQNGVSILIDSFSILNFLATVQFRL